MVWRKKEATEITKAMSHLRALPSFVQNILVNIIDQQSMILYQDVLEKNWPLLPDGERRRILDRVSERAAEKNLLSRPGRKRPLVWSVLIVFSTIVVIVVFLGRSLGGSRGGILFILGAALLAGSGAAFLNNLVKGHIQRTFVDSMLRSSSLGPKDAALIRAFYYADPVGFFTALFEESETYFPLEEKSV